MNDEIKNLNLEAVGFDMVFMYKVITFVELSVNEDKNFSFKFKGF